MMLSIFINYLLCMGILTSARKVVPGDFVYDDDYAGYEKYGYVTCQCEASSSVMARIESNILDKIYKNLSESFGTVQEVSFNPRYPSFPDTKICKACKATYFTCSEEDKLNCVGRVISFEMALKEKKAKNIWRVIPKQTFQIFPETVDIPIGRRKISRRQLRLATTCFFPYSLETAGIFCKAFPSFIKCVQRCAFGYTLEDGISREMMCKYSENKWVPKGFKECKPFVDCAVSLISGGSLNCTSMNVMQAPECDIECLHYEDKEAVPKTSYTCKINGEWDPPLPFCAVPHSGLALVEAPKNKLHYDNSD